MRFCPTCGKQVTNEATACMWCGTNLQTPAAAPFTGVPTTNGKAVGSLVAGFFSLFFPAAVAAVVLGHISRSEIRRSNGRQTGSGMALAGLIMGYLGVSLIPFLIIAAIAIPNLLRSRMAANEASAVGSLRTYTTAMVTYAANCPKLGYPDSIAKLGVGSGDCDHANLMTGELANPNAVRHGYRFVYRPGDRDAQGIVIEYTIEAEPMASGTTGQRYFFTDQTGVIRANARSKADADSPPLL